MRRLLIALRIARRSSVRSIGRSSLIVALIALPLCGMAAATLMIASTVPTDAERLAVDLGRTQAKVEIVAPPDAGVGQDPFDLHNWGTSADADASTSDGRRTLTEVLPAGASVIPVLQTQSTVRVGDRLALVSTTEGATWSPELHGRYRLTHGHAPKSRDEVLATAGALDRLGVRLGGTITLEAPVHRTVTVVGEMDSRSEPSSDAGLFGMAGTFTGDPAILKNPQTIAYLPETALTWSQVQHLNAQGAIALSRDVFAHPPAPDSLTYRSGPVDNLGIQFLMVTMVVGFVLIEVLLLSGAAFMVGARAQERSLATVASVGAPRSTLLGIISANGLVLGAVGGIVGVATGIGAGSLAMRLTDDGSATRYWGYHLWWPAMIGIAVAAILIGWLGALIPAIRASRIDIVRALRGARRPAPIGRRRPVVGAVIALFGIAVTLGGGLTMVAALHGSIGGGWLSKVTLTALIAGPAIVLLGLVFCTGLLLRLAARLGARVSVSARLASRDAARNTGRSVPALAVVMTTVFVAVFAMVMIASSEYTARESYTYNAVVGQVKIPLGQNADGTATTPAQEQQIVQAVHSAVGSADVRVLRSVKTVSPDLLFSNTKLTPSQSRTLIPVAAVPAAHQCPHDPTSANYDPETRVEASTAWAEAQNDPRCMDQYLRYSDQATIWVGGADDLAAIIGHRPSAAALHALDAGGAVALHPLLVNDGEVTIAWHSLSQLRKENSRATPPAPAIKTHRLNTVVQKTAHLLPYGILISAKTASSLGLSAHPATVLATPSSPVTQQQQDTLTGRLAPITGSQWSIVSVERGPDDSAGLWAWGLLGLSALIAIGSAGVAISLARADGRRDQATLAAVGASRLVRRGFGFWQGIVLTGVGAVLGAAVGFVPAIALTLPGTGIDFAAPWIQILGTVTILPLTIAAVAWLITGREGRFSLRAAIE